MKAIVFIFISIILLFACGNKHRGIDDPEADVPYSYDTLLLIDSLLLSIDEPSGLCYNPFNESFFTICDNPPNKLFEFDLQGRILQDVAVVGEDLEGVTFRTADSTIWLVDEFSSEVICLNRFGLELDRYVVDFIPTIENKGIEGISYNSINQYFYLVTEKDPGLLLQWHPDEGIVMQKHLDFALDFSGITHDALNNKLWIVSDESRSLYYCDLEGNALREYFLAKYSIEGMVPMLNETMFIGVSDWNSKLLTFSIKN